MRVEKKPLSHHVIYPLHATFVVHEVMMKRERILARERKKSKFMGHARLNSVGDKVDQSRFFFL